MGQKYNRDWLVTELANRAHFTKSDIDIILNVLVEIFTEVALNNATLSVRSFGKLYSQDIPPRRGIHNRHYEATKRIVFKLAENIRYSQRNERREMS